MLAVGQFAYGQVPGVSNFLFAQEYSKEMSLYKAKEYVIKNILKSSEEVVQFEIDPLAAAFSGELTSLVYKCPSKDISGLLLCFYGNFWNDAGVTYTGYGFKNLPKEKAVYLLSLISKTIKEQNDYLSSVYGENNAYFNYDDLTILLYKGTDSAMRVFWGSFDATWTSAEFSRTKKRFEKSFK